MCQGVRRFGVFNTVLAISSSGYYARARARTHTHTRSSVVNSPLSRIIRVFLAFFGKLRKATISFVMSVRLSAWNNSASTGRIYVKFGIWIFFENIEKIQVSLKSDKNESYFTWRSIHIFLSNLAKFFLEWEIFQTKFVQKIKTHILCSVTPPSLPPPSLRHAWVTEQKEQGGLMDPTIRVYQIR